MKKLFSCILAILILAFSVVPAFAEEEEPTTETKTASLSISATSTTVSKDDTVTITVKVSEGLNAINLGVTYNSEYFAYVSDTSGGTFSMYEPSSGTSGKFSCTAYENESGAGGTVASITLKVNEVPSGNGATISASATGNGGKVSVSGSSVTIKCAHKTTEKNVVKPTCTTEGKSGDQCKDCGEFLNATILPASHTFGQWTSNSNSAIEERSCAVCGFVETRAQGGNTEIPDEPVTDPETEFPSYPFYEDEDDEPVTQPQKKPNNNGNYRPEQKDEEDQTEKKGLAALFASSSEVSDSDKAAILVVVLAVVIVVVLAIYILLLNQRKRK